YVVDLNFRLNASTPAVLLAPALVDRLGEGITHFRTLRGSSTASEMAAALKPWVAAGRVIALSLFDPATAGYRSEPATVQALIVGASMADVIATEQEMARAGSV